MLLEYLFLRRAAERVSALVRDYNERALRCFEACGFLREGVARHACYIDGHYHNVVLLGILREDFTGAS